MAKNKNKKHRYIIYKKCNYTCMLCGLIFKIPDNWDTLSCIWDYGMPLEIDHIYPLSKGGLDIIENKQTLCQKCNNKKSDIL